MEFTPSNGIVKQCIQGMGLEGSGQQEEARKVFLQAWDASTYDFEKFIAAHYVARSQSTPANELNWLETALQLALKINDDSVISAVSPLYLRIANCFEKLGDDSNAKRNRESAAHFNDTPSSKGPFYHGTRADLKVGDLLTPGGSSNYQADLKMNHIYFTASANGAGLAAALAKGEGAEHVYLVEPTGPFENDPNLTNNKFPGNPTRSYRSTAPLKIVGEVTDWAKQVPVEIEKWREKLANSKGEIIN